MAESAVSIVIENLVPLLVHEARLLKGIHSKVASIKSELEIIQSFLKDADTRAEKEDTSNVMKTWVKQFLRLHDGYEGEQLHIEGGGFQKLKFLGLVNLEGLNRLIIDEGAMPLLEQLEIGPSPQLKEVPSGIHHLQSLKDLEFYDMPIEFELSLQPDNGPDFWKVKHIPSVIFWHRIQGLRYKTYKLGEANSRGGEPKCPPHI